MIRIVPAVPDHIPLICAKVREDDRKEMMSLLWTPRTALKISLDGAVVAWTAFNDDTPLCIFGLSNGELGDGKPWMIGTTDIENCSFSFLKECRRQLNEMLRLRKVLVNYVSADSFRTIRWLTWLGFQIGEPIPWGPQRHLFRRFEVSR